jgi:hypothetical protein
MLLYQRWDALAAHQTLLWAEETISEAGNHSCPKNIYTSTYIYIHIYMYIYMYSLLAQTFVCYLTSVSVHLSLIPMAQSAISSCVEARRAAALSSHSAAGLVTSVRKVAGQDAAKFAEVARLLRSSEALARSAVAALSGMAALARTSLPPRASGTAEAGAPALAVSSKAARRRKKKKDSEKEVLPFVETDRKMDVDIAVATPALSPSPSLVASSASGPTPAALGNAQTVPFYPVGSSVVIFGLASRKDLEGTIGIVIAASSSVDERVAIRTASGQQVRVRHQNIKTSLFAAGFS